MAYRDALSTNPKVRLITDYFTLLMKPKPHFRLSPKQLKRPRKSRDMHRWEGGQRISG
jgi:hypothetical protein